MQDKEVEQEVTIEDSSEGCCEECSCEVDCESSSEVRIESDRETQWEQEREELINQILRLKADFDNYKRRNQTQLESIRSLANESLISDLLPVVDNFERALQATKEDSPLVSGVKMIFDQLLSNLKKQGLEPIECLGQPFDPRVHEAVTMDGDSSANLIVSGELQKGYVYQGKVLRASMVEVAEEQLEEEK